MWCAPPYTLSIGSRHIQFCHLANEHHRHLHMHFELINVRNVIRPNSMSTTYTWSECYGTAVKRYHSVHVHGIQAICANWTGRHYWLKRYTQQLKMPVINSVRWFIWLHTIIERYVWQQKEMQKSPAFKHSTNEHEEWRENKNLPQKLILNLWCHPDRLENNNNNNKHRQSTYTINPLQSLQATCVCVQSTIFRNVWMPKIKVET